MLVDDCRKGLAAIGQVAELLIKRTEAEFNEEDLYLAYEAYDLDAWAQYLEAPTLNRDVATRLSAATSKISAALGIAHDPDKWLRAARVALDRKAKMKTAAGSASTPARDVDDHRAAGRVRVVRPPRACTRA